ncbi:MAG: glycogen synthase GlgA [Pararhodobacter sp.]|nr:glycogen synthase GlgA [Pararhodobacter sp.]
MSAAAASGRPALAVASECAPLVKTGGLADVVGALPAALATQGWALRTLLPGYPAVMAAARRARQVAGFDDLLGTPARVLACSHAGLELLVLDAPALFDRPGGPYLGPDGRDWPDNDRRFAALCLAAAQLADQGIGAWRPQVLHLHDWQAGLTPAYLRARGSTLPCLMSIHNIAFHGLTPATRLAALALPPEGFTIDGFEFYGHVSALKAGLTGAQAIATVSPGYARELLTPAFGMGLEGVLQARAPDLHGILNGIDTNLWNPATDAAITPYTSPAGKAANRARLVDDFGLVPGDGPLAVVVSRLSAQKGLDLLLDALPGYLARGGRLALLGSGERALENAWLAAGAASPGQLGVRIGYDQALSHRMYAGADAVLVPSRFEPCGLTQLYALRYGALPVVARTGGLADTVIHANEAALAAGVATGIVHDAESIPALAQALGQLCQLWQDRRVFRQMQRNAMKHPVGWQASAPRYAALYAALSDNNKADTP